MVTTTFGSYYHNYTQEHFVLVIRDDIVTKPTFDLTWLVQGT
jgi:hypothetical protein